MSGKRVHTSELLEMLELTVPLSTMRMCKVVGIVVAWRRLVTFTREGEGWVAVLGSGHELQQRNFHTFGEAYDLLEELWPGDDQGQAEIMSNDPELELELGRPVEAITAVISAAFAASGEELVWRTPGRSRLVVRLFGGGEGDET